ncbi:MAG: ABC transporter permease [Candidatus Bathyarchaeota archaeon]|nr:ABC transporter permease [Candidatus Bathyarchaeota archaeon]
MSLMRFSAMVQKEFLQFIRDRRTLIIAFGLPMIFLLSFASASVDDIQNLPIAVVNEDMDGSLSRDVIAELEKSQLLTTSIYYNSVHDARQAVINGEVWGAIIIPSGFSEGIQMSRIAPLVFYLDNSKLLMRLVQPEFYAITSKLSQQFSIQFQTANVLPGVHVEAVAIPVFGTLSTTASSAPLAVALVLQQTGIILTAVSITREKEQGTFEHLVVTPVTILEILFSKFVTYFILSSIIATIMYGAMSIGYSLDLFGSLISVSVLTMLYIVVSIGMGLIIAVTSANQLQALQVGSFLLLPAMIFSGMLIPIEGMKTYARIIAYLNPVYLYSTGMTKILQSRLSIFNMNDIVIQMLLIIVVTFGLSVKTFSKTIK